MATKEFTGRKMLILTVSAFAVIIGVNLVLAYQAIHTFPGLEVKNSYVASQTFNRDKVAQLALGWDVSAEFAGSNIVLTVLDEYGQPVRDAVIAGTLGRATNVRDDQTPEWTFDGKAYVAPVKLAPGYWNLRLDATAADGTKFKQLLKLHVN